MPLYQCQPPTGYADAAEAWTNAGALVNRMNFALALASGRLGRPGAGGLANPVTRPAEPVGRGRSTQPPAAADWIEAIETSLAGDISDATRATIAKAATVSDRVALALGSPEFQRQ
jgi:uncharacterized protein (DUF1800 family)